MDLNVIHKSSLAVFCMVFLIQVIMSSIAGLLAWLLVDWTFKDVAFFSIATALMLFYALTVRKKGGRTPFVIRLPFVIIALVCLVIVVMKLPVLFPLRMHIKGGTFQDASLATILQHISKQQQESPYWRFLLYDKAAVNKRVSLTIPDKCTLKQALDSISESVQCDYDWYWNKASNTPPNCVTIRLWQRGSTLTSKSDYILFVQGSDVWYSPDNRLNN